MGPPQHPAAMVAVSGNEVWLDEFNRWAAPLADGIAPRLVWRALCDDLQIPPERRFGVDRPGRDAPEE